MPRAEIRLSTSGEPLVGGFTTVDEAGGDAGKEVERRRVCSMAQGCQRALGGRGVNRALEARDCSE